ncbi:MAG: recombinase family protein [Candidatus Pacebacteria bacterium]|nr:recombinase family protein [Candidatus Paceibacterota bacterium]MCF7862711.1 recombinase family protein [Candidatus Paceibacterota bacterium]
METYATNILINPKLTEAITMKYCLYARKSSEAEEKQALSIDSQIKEMLTLSQRENLNIVEIYKESHSAKDCGQRPVYNQLLNDIRIGKFNAILVWHPDRLARNAGDLGAIVDLLDQKKLIEIRTYSQRFTNNPNEKFLLMILGSQAKLENDNKSINVKRGLRTRVESGLWPSVAPTGYLNHPDRTMKCHVIPDPLRSHVVRLLFEKALNENLSIRKLYKWAKEDVKFTTRNGKPLTLSNIQVILRNNFYMGMIEYPRQSGKWYLGRHDPIVSKEIFQRVQERLDTKKNDKKIEKEFAFTRLIKCGMCKSGVTADEKHKNLANGSVAKYIYYGCTKFNDKQCKNTYIREEELISQLLEIIDRIDINNVGIKEKLEKEIERYSEFRNKVLDLTNDEKIAKTKLDVRNYMKYLLKEGTLQEKRDLMQSFTSKLILINKRVVIE